MNEIYCKKIFLKNGKVLLGIVKDSTELPNAKRITTAKKTYDVSNESIERIDTTEQVFKRW